MENKKQVQNRRSSSKSRLASKKKKGGGATGGGNSFPVGLELENEHFHRWPLCSFMVFKNQNYRYETMRTTITIKTSSFHEITTR